MKRIITLTITLCMILSCFTVTSSAMAKKPAKYTKVKTATYQKYKKAYDNQKKLNNKIKAQQNTIKQLNKQLANKQAAYNAAINQCDLAEAETAEIQKELNNAKSMNKWIWTNLKSMGIKYNSKTWILPDSYPETFFVDGTQYRVIIQKVPEQEDEVTP